MSTIRIIAESKDTVTVSRDDWESLQLELESLQDCAAVAERRAYERQVGKDNARRDYLTGDEAIRLLNGENPLKVWREKRGLSQRALAAATDIGNSYLAEIETNRKPGSGDAYRKLGAVLHVPPEELDARRPNKTLKLIVRRRHFRQYIMGAFGLPTKHWNLNPYS